MATSLISTGLKFPDDTVQTTAATAGGGSIEAVASGSLSDGSKVVINADGTVSAIGGSPTNLTAENFIGISDGAYSDTATATIQVAGAVDDAQSDLTAGQAYYVQPDGTLSTTAGTPEVFAGTAVSSTKLIVKG